MVTPLLAQDMLDVPGLERLVEHLVGGGPAGLFLLGTTGEGPSLSHRIRHELVERTCRLVAGRVPVLVCITDSSFTESVELANHAAECGAQAVVATAPYYFPLSQPELLEYTEALVRELPLPLMLYNIPAMTKVAYEVETVQRLMENPGIIGIKDSSGDLSHFRRLLQISKGRKDWTVFMGQEELTAEVVREGASGGVNGGANIDPRLYVDNYECAARGDAARGAECHARVLRVADTIYTVGRHASSMIKGVKCALSLLGICSDVTAQPFRHFGSPERERVRQRLVELGYLSP